MSTSLKLPAGLSLITNITGCLGLIQSVIWVSLFAVAMHSYLDECPEAVVYPINPTDVFGKLLQQFYFNKDDCMHSIIPNEIREISPLTSDQVFIWAAIGVSFSSVWLILSIVLLFYVRDDKIKTLNLVLYSWCIVTLAITVIDLTLGILFGISYHHITDAMAISDEIPGPEALNLINGENIVMLDLIRLASLLLMSISLRGFVMLIINITLASIIFWYTLDINKIILESQQHSIYSREPINAFASQKHGSNNVNLWQTNSSDFEQPMREERSIPNSLYGRGLRPASEERSWRPTNNMDREPGHNNIQSDRPELWRREPSNMTGRPFSYLAEPRPVRQPSAVASPTAPTVMSPPWKRNPNWDPAPPVPAPDYSPLQNRKLKSALKSGYNY